MPTPLHWGRIAVGGFVAGLVWTSLSLLLLGIVGREFMAALFNGSRAPGGNVPPGCAQCSRSGKKGEEPGALKDLFQRRSAEL